MKRVELDKHKFDTKTKTLVLLAMLVFAAYLQSIRSDMANEVVVLIIGLAGGNALSK